MSEEKRSIFRQQALDRLSSPERLDRLMQVVSPKDWLPLGGLVVFAILAVLWSVFGKIPITVTGKGILINPRRVVQLQFPISGELESLNIRDGQCVEKDNLIANNQEQNQVQEVEQAIARLEQEVADKSVIKSSHTGCIIELTATVGQYLNPGTTLGTLQNDGEASDMMSFTYFAVEDGKKIRPQMPILITPDTVKRTRFGGIVGEITQVSALPITSEGATSVVGNAEVVQQLMGGAGGKIEAIAQLQSDSQTFSGYSWSSSTGPQLEISPGTTTTVRVTVEQRSPISFVLPILREWSGIN